jgi:hypothetical protein
VSYFVKKKQSRVGQILGLVEPASVESEHWLFQSTGILANPSDISCKYLNNGSMEKNETYGLEVFPE